MGKKITGAVKDLTKDIIQALEKADETARFDRLVTLAQRHTQVFEVAAERALKKVTIDNGEQLINDVTAETARIRQEAMQAAEEKRLAQEKALE